MRNSASFLRWVAPFAAGLFVAWPARAVPVPWNNCGTPGDLLSVVKLDADRWPPRGAPGPLVATAVFGSGSATVTSLQVHLLLGLAWDFQTVGSLNAPVVNGFVNLPASIPLALVSPSLPVLAGPYMATQTLTSPFSSAAPLTIATSGNLAQALTAASGTLSVSFNGNSGFPVYDLSGTYQATLQVTGQDGLEVFCFHFTDPDTRIVQDPVTLPMLSLPMLAATAAVLGLIGLLALQSRPL